MKAVLTRKVGGPEALEFCNIPEPEFSADDVRIRVKAFGLNKAEAYNRRGHHGAFSGKWAQGIEAAGVVIDDPSGNFAKGQKVVTAMGGMMFSRHGSYAEIISVKRENVIAIQSDIDFVTLASLPEAFLTAWGALHFNLALKQGETLLVRGGTSSVGMAAIVYAKHIGANVIATTRKQENTAKLFALGADHVVIDSGEIESDVRAIKPEGVDKALELVGAVAIRDTLKAVRRWGEAVFVGFLGGKPSLPDFHFMNDMPNTVKLSFFGSGIFGSQDFPLTNTPIDDIADAIYRGKLPSILSETFRVENIREAHELLEQSTALGKIVITR